MQKSAMTITTGHADGAETPPVPWRAGINEPESSSPSSRHLQAKWDAGRQHWWGTGDGVCCLKVKRQIPYQSVLVISGTTQQHPSSLAGELCPAAQDNTLESPSCWPAGGRNQGRRFNKHKCQAGPGRAVMKGHHLPPLLSASPPAVLHSLLLHSGQNPSCSSLEPIPSSLTLLCSQNSAPAFQGSGVPIAGGVIEPCRCGTWGQCWVSGGAQ